MIGDCLMMGLDVLDFRKVFGDGDPKKTTYESSLRTNPLGDGERVRGFWEMCYGQMIFDNV